MKFVSSVEMTEFGGVYVGFTDENTHEIRLLKGRGLAEDQITLLHELMHVVIGTDHSNDIARVHWFIYAASEGLQELFEGNPDLVHYLARREYEK